MDDETPASAWGSGLYGWGRLPAPFRASWNTMPENDKFDTCLRVARPADEGSILALDALFFQGCRV